MKPALISRRELLQLTGAAALGSACAPRLLLAAGAAAGELGCVVGEATGERVGLQVLAEGGNAIDAVVAAAIAAPRLHTEGDAMLSLEKAWPATERDGLRRRGYTVNTAGSANMNAVALEDGVLHKSGR